MDRAINYYEVLCVPFGADRADIISAYRRLCKLYHPDLNAAPEAEEQMKRINQAYYILASDHRRSAYDKAMERERLYSRTQGGAERARAIMERYFDALQCGAFERAYGLLSDYDRQYVTLQSFCKWRHSVQGLFPMRGFSILPGEQGTKITLEDGRTLPAQKLAIQIAERDLANRSEGQYEIAKLAIWEGGVWRIFLGYRDLNEIARVFESLSIRQEQGEMAEHWKQHCIDTCRELSMLSRAGLLKEARRELYRYARYRQPLCAALFRLHAEGAGLPGARLPDFLEVAGRAMQEALRETDIPAYLGDGVFAVLLIELQKKNIRKIAERMAEKMRAALRRDCGAAIPVFWVAEPYEGGELDACLAGLLNKLPK